MQNPAEAKCLVGGAWSIGNNFCKKVTCVGSIANGRLDNRCTRMVGSSCTVTCNDNYVNIADEVICMADGTWSLDTVCKRTPCNKTIRNGEFSSSCSGEYPSECDFTCDKPYYKSTITATKLKCDTSGQWKFGQAPINTVTLCTAILCLGNISNANIDKNNCSRKVFSICDFQCNRGFVKNTGVTKATCLETGAWSTNDVTACVATCTGQFRCNSGQCIPLDQVCDKKVDCTDKSDEGENCVTCPDTIKNGDLISCNRTVGTACNFSCETGFNKVDDKVICLDDGKWHIQKPCQVNQCPNMVENGQISPKCKNFDVGSSCDIICNDNFELVQKMRVKCLPTGLWNVSKGLCVAIQVQPQKSAQGLSTGQSVGIAVGVAILMLIIAAVVMLVVLYKRRLLPGRFTSSPKATYSASDIAIENPGYGNADISVRDDTRYENPYDNAREYQPSYSNGPDQQEAGYINPLYKTQINVSSNEPLPEQGDIGVNLDSVVLTTDSWQKEQLKGPDA